MPTPAFAVGDVIRRKGAKTPWRIESIGRSTDYWMRGREVYRLVSLTSGKHDEYPTSYASDYLARWEGELPSTTPGPTLLAGHTLRAEGAAFSADKERLHGYGYGRSGKGRGLCSCGDLSEPLPSAGARKTWHKNHKTTIRSTQVDA